MFLRTSFMDDPLTVPYISFLETLSIDHLTDKYYTPLFLASYISTVLFSDNSLSTIVPEEFHGLVGKPGPVSIKFDVIDARIEVKQHEKYVVSNLSY